MISDDKWLAFVEVLEKIAFALEAIELEQKRQGGAF